jgi:hypothetical protein
MNLWQDFLTNSGRETHKWAHYFPVYERHFAWYRNKALTFLEIGVGHGGSLEMWQRFFGPFARIVGVDINENCKSYEAPGIDVRIGDQSDERFLKSLINEFGVPDVVLDDGSHRMEDIATSFNYLYPKMPKNAVYMVEDLHTAYWDEFGGGMAKPSSFINLSKGFIDKLNAEHTRGQLEPDFITRQTFGINFYDSIVVLEKGDVWRKESLRIGRKPEEPGRVAQALRRVVTSLRPTDHRGASGSSAESSD